MDALEKRVLELEERVNALEHRKVDLEKIAEAFRRKPISVPLPICDMRL